MQSASEIAIVSVLFNEPKLLKCGVHIHDIPVRSVSVLFNEPKLLKLSVRVQPPKSNRGFSALQRAEIAEMVVSWLRHCLRFSVSVLFNEPKLLKYTISAVLCTPPPCFSALQRAEIAEILPYHADCLHRRAFQCSSTSRNC